jgi:hypothetical protein
MFVCDHLTEECNVVHEPDCTRGGPVTAYSVTGTGPGRACKPPKTPPPEPPAPPPAVCKTTVSYNNRRNYLANNNGATRIVC